VRVVRPPPGDAAPAKDANEALLAGCDLGAMLAAAKLLRRDEIVLFQGEPLSVYTTLYIQYTCMYIIHVCERVRVHIC
jgi:hypothetical protein